jgi:3',5'-nucleoside bisphosphate phosphatase
VRIDLHTHSDVSDGTTSPTQLVRDAAAARLDVLGLTDHDTARGWDEAAAAAEQEGVRLVRGMELSTRLDDGRGVHLLAYLPDPTSPALVEELERVLGGRGGRVPEMVARLNEHGMAITVDDVARQAGDTAALGRPHVADALVAAGYVAHRDDAFADWLMAGRPAYVGRYAAPITRMIGLVEAAGGATVIAHPWGRHDPSTLPASALAELREAGLSGIETDHQDHTPSQRRELRAIADDLDLVRTGSSDHHGEGKRDHDLGCNLTEPEQLERLLERAAAAAARSGAAVPPGP